MSSKGYFEQVLHPGLQILYIVARNTGDRTKKSMRHRGEFTSLEQRSPPEFPNKRERLPHGTDQRRPGPKQHRVKVVVPGPS
jgi:hypothetical protein